MKPKFKERVLPDSIEVLELLWGNRGKLTVFVTRFTKRKNAETAKFQRFLVVGVVIQNFLKSKQFQRLKGSR
jgi:hypothetical protein